MRLDPKELRHISLNWKLLIPFLLLPAVLTTLFVGWGIRTQNLIISRQEEARLRQNYHNFQQRLDLRLNIDKTLAELVALNPEAQEALAVKDRARLMDMYEPLYSSMKRLPGIKQFHFLTDPGVSLLRLHQPSLYGDRVRRRTVFDALETGRTVGGLEMGATGLSLRGVAPVFYQARTVGGVEVGTALNRDFLTPLEEDFGYNITIYVPQDHQPYNLRVAATTAVDWLYLEPDAVQAALDQKRVTYQTLQPGSANLAVLIGPVLGYDGRPVAAVEMTGDRSRTLFSIKRHTTLIVTFGVVLLIVALAFVWWVSAKFLAPIDSLVDQAEKIADGQRVAKMNVRARDEFGTLADALNRMLTVQEEARDKLRNYAHELEERVQERTAELVQSEEKFRTLVDHIPLVVYRLEPGLIRSFVSNHIEKLTGWPPEEMVGEAGVWSQLIHPSDRQRVLEAKQDALEHGRVLEIEYRIMGPSGEEIDVLDHAEPIFNLDGEVENLEGYLLDIRERRRLQEQTVQTEELKTLSEISERLAHEFRNPLSVVGLSARRLKKVLDGGEKGKEYADIIIDQISRLELIINMIQGYIKPIVARFEPVSARELVIHAIDACQECIEEGNIELEVEDEPDLPEIEADRGLMERVWINLIRNAAYQMPSKGQLKIVVRSKDGRVIYKVIYPAGYLSDDHLRHFFYPFTTEDADASQVDLPLVPVIVHKHGGVINVGRLGDDLVSVSVELPVQPPKPSE
jgi:PAS domain S-box-containing protein